MVRLHDDAAARRWSRGTCSTARRPGPEVRVSHIEGNRVPYEVHHGNGASMWHLVDGAVDFVLTSPPYYPRDLEPLLVAPVVDQNLVDEVDEEVTALALSLGPVFHEVARVLRRDGKFVVQTRDLRYGGYLLGPADTHRRLAEASGFRL